MTIEPTTGQQITALLNRATTGAMAAAENGNLSNFRFFQGMASALKDLGSPGLIHVTKRDLRHGGYEALHGTDAAFARVRADVEHLTLAQVQQILAGSGVQIALHPVAHSQLDAGAQLEHRVGVVVNANSEQPALGIDGHDGAGEHAGNVAHGGAA